MSDEPNLDVIIFMKRDVETIKRAIEQGAPINYRTVEDTLYHFDGEQCLELLKLLFEKNVEIDATSLIYAAGCSIDVFKYVYNHLVNNVYDEPKYVVFNWGFNRAFIEAAAHGKTETLMYMTSLREKYKDLDDGTVYEFYTDEEAFDNGLPDAYFDNPMYAAATNGHAETVKYLESI